MKFTCKTAVVSGVVGGYFLGRTKKGKLALVLATLFMGRRHGFGPQELIKKGAAKLTKIPQIGELGDQVREDLMTAARTAVTASVNRRIEGISDSVHERTQKFVEAKQEELNGKSAERAGKPSGAGEQEADEESRQPEAKESEDADRQDGEQSGEKESARRSRSAEERAERREKSRSERFSRR